MSSAEALKLSAFENLSENFGLKENLKIRKLLMNVDHRDSISKMQKLSLGCPNVNIQTKVVLLVGGTGTGKTTLINSMVNYIFNVNFDDDFRFLLVEESSEKSQTESQTDYITAYEFNYMNGMPFQYNYVLVDTPGLGDTRGIQKDHELVGHLFTFLQQNYIREIDAIGLVTSSSSARLTQSELYIFNNILALFGKDFDKSIFIMATFADAKRPPVLSALKEANVNYMGFYKFNNSALYSKNRAIELLSDNDCDSMDEEDSIHINQQFWKVGIRSLEKFFRGLNGRAASCLMQTKDVLRSRIQLKNTIQQLHDLLQMGFLHLVELETEEEKLKKIDNDIKNCNNYEELISVSKIQKINLYNNDCVTNCTTCNSTCHYPCTCYSGKIYKRHCAAMSSGYCTICPQKCRWDVHYHMDFRFQTNWSKEKRIINDVYQIYEANKTKKLNKEQSIGVIQSTINGLGRQLIPLIQDVHHIMAVLERYALRPNPISSKEYIDLLISSEKMQKLYNFQNRIKELEKIKNEFIVLSLVKNSAPAVKKGAEYLLKYFKLAMN